MHGEGRVNLLFRFFFSFFKTNKTEFVYYYGPPLVPPRQNFIIRINSTPWYSSNYFLCHYGAIKTES